MEQGVDRRGAERVHLDVEAVIIEASGTSSPVRVRDLSATGIGVRDHPGLQIGATVHVLLFGASLPCTVRWTADTLEGSTAGLSFRTLDTRAEATVRALISDVRRTDDDAGGPQNRALMSDVRGTEH
jgi:hypothetical protein